MLNLLIKAYSDGFSRFQKFMVECSTWCIAKPSENEVLVSILRLISYQIINIFFTFDINKQYPFLNICYNSNKKKKKKCLFLFDKLANG